MAKQYFKAFEAFQNGTAEQYKELLSIYLKGKATEEELDFMALNCESSKGIFFSERLKDLRVGKFDLQKPVSFKEFKNKMINTFDL